MALATIYQNPSFIKTLLRKFTTKSLSNGTSNCFILSCETLSVTTFALVNLFCKLLVVQRPKTCLVNAWHLSRSQVQKDKVKNPHVHCEHSSCLHGNSVCIATVYVIRDLSWSGSPCNQGSKTSTQLQPVTVKEPLQYERFKILLTASKWGKFVLSQHVQGKGFCSVTGTCHSDAILGGPVSLRVEQGLKLSIWRTQGTTIK